MIDTHSHIYEPEFDLDRDDVVARAKAVGLECLLLPAIDSASDERLFATCRRYGDYVVPMMGLHPTSVNDNPSWREELLRVERYLAAPPQGIGHFCAVGEIGLDLYWSREWREEQLEAFRQQLEWSLAYDLPVVIHTRDAWDDMVAVIGEYRNRGLRGVFHAFSSDVACYEQLRACGDFLFGIGGVVTFKKSPLADVVPSMSLDDILLETDSPYLTPVPHRGERNESSYTRFVCAKIAELHNVDYEDVVCRTTASAKRMFNL